MTKEIQKLKRQLLMEELRRQGKTGKQRLLIGGVAVLALLLIGGLIWYRANLDSILEERFVKAQAMRQSGRHDEAVERFRTLYQDNPDFHLAPEALLQAAEILDLYLFQYQESLLTYLLLERDYPEAEQTVLAQRQIASLYKYRLGDCAQAIAAYQKVLDSPIDDADRVQYEVADCYFRLNNFEQARIEFESLQKRFAESPLLPEVQYRVAVTYALEGQLPEAAGAYRLVMERWPEDPYALEARFGLAGVLEEQEKLKESLTLLEGLLELYPNPVALEQKIEQVRSRIAKKKKAI